MENSVLFSVIIPVYNIENYIDKCVNSVLKQDFDNYEIILVDDGSNDKSPIICDKYEQTSNKVKVIHKQNGGLVSARKAGAEIADGEYIVCVDGDDWIDEHCLSHYFSIVQNFSPDIIISGSISAFRDEAKNHVNKLPYQKGLYQKEKIVEVIFPLLIQDKYANYFAPSVWAKAYRSDLYKKQQLSVDNKIKIGEDSACTIPCIYNANTLYISDATTYYYRQNPSSMTKERKAFDWNCPELIHNHIQEQIDIRKFDFQEQLYRKTAHELFTVVVSQFNRNEPYREIVRDIKKHLQNPTYDECIKKAKFISLNGKLAVFSMRYKLYLLCFCFFKLKQKSISI